MTEGLIRYPEWEIKITVIGIGTLLLWLTESLIAVPHPGQWGYSWAIETVEGSTHEKSYNT